MDSNLHGIGWAGAALLDRILEGEAPPVEPILVKPGRVVGRHSTATFHFGGDGDVNEVRTQLAGVSRRRQVRLLGWLNDDAKSTLLSRASVFVLPSYNEGLPVALLEAMAHGVAVVTTPVGGIPEVVTDSKTGLLVAPGDVATIAGAICRLLENPSLRTTLGRNGRALIESEFSVERAVARIVAVYDSLAGRAG